MAKYPALDHLERVLAVIAHWRDCKATDRYCEECRAGERVLHEAILFAKACPEVRL